MDLKKLKLGNDEQGQTASGPHLQPMASYDGYMESGNAAEFANFAHFTDGNSKVSTSTSLDFIFKVIDLAERLKANSRRTLKSDIRVLIAPVLVKVKYICKTKQNFH